MSEEREAKRLSIGETHRRMTHLFLDARGIKLGDFIHTMIDKSIRLKEQEQKQADEQSDAHKTAEALAKLSKGQDALCEKQDALRQDFADVGDTMCEIVGKERIPPEREEIDDNSRRELYELVKRIKAKRTGKRGALDRFMDTATWRFRGFTVREIFKDTYTLNKFYHAEDVAKKREQKSGNA